MRAKIYTYLRTSEQKIIYGLFLSRLREMISCKSGTTLNRCLAMIPVLERLHFRYRTPLHPIRKRSKASSLELPSTRLSTLLLGGVHSTCFYNCSTGLSTLHLSGIGLTATFSRQSLEICLFRLLASDLETGNVREYSRPNFLSICHLASFIGLQKIESLTGTSYCSVCGSTWQLGSSSVGVGAVAVPYTLCTFLDRKAKHTH